MNGDQPKIEIFEPFGGVGLEDCQAQIVGELALALNALEDGLLAVGQLAEKSDPCLDMPNDLLVEPAGPFRR